MATKRKTTAKKQSAVKFYSEDDRFVADYMTSIGKVDLWKDQRVWEDIASKLTSGKHLRVDWCDLRSHWSVVDGLLEHFYDVKLPTHGLLGFTAMMSQAQKFKIYTERLWEAIVQMRARSDKMRIRPYEVKYAPVLHTLFAAGQEGASCLDHQTIVLPPKIFEGIAFYLLDSVDSLVGSACRVPLEYLVTIHGGKIVQKAGGYNGQIICITGQDETRNQQFYDTHHDNIYLPSLIYDHVKAKLAPTNRTMMDHVYFYRGFDAASKTFGLGSSAAEGQLKRPEKTVKLVGLPTNTHYLDMDNGDENVLSLETIVDKKQDNEQACSFQSNVGSQEADAQLPSANPATNPLKEPCYFEYLDLNDDNDVFPMDANDLSDVEDPIDREPRGSEEKIRKKKSLFFLLAHKATSMRNLAFEVSKKYSEQCGEQFADGTARRWDRDIRAKALSEYLELAEEYNLNESMLTAFLALGKMTQEGPN